MGADGEGGGFGWCNVFIKFLLFLTNFVIWIVGVLALALGIFILVDNNVASLESELNLQEFLSVPAIFLLVIGVILFIIGFCGCFGALLEIFFLLVIYSAIMSIVVLLEVAGVVYVVVQTQVTMSSSVDYRQIIQTTFDSSISGYYEDDNVRSVVDLLQGNLLRCCGATGPNDWERNPYFNCSSIAFTRCSVPPSCCIQEDGEVINLQCGYQTLDVASDRFHQNIHTVGCLQRVDGLISGNLYTILGVGIGLLVLQILCVLLASGLAVDVHREKKVAKAIKKQEKLEQQGYGQTSKL